VVSPAIVIGLAVPVLVMLPGLLTTVNDVIVVPP
jgi:hypothetical protein